MRPVTLGLAQITGDPLAPDANRKATGLAARRAFDAGADLVLLPELIVSGYVADSQGLREVSESLEGPTVESWVELAAQAGGLVVGGFCERERTTLYNTAVVVDGSGILAHYRKLHLFDREKHVFAPGDRGLPVVDTTVGRLGVCVCYDMRFVEVLRLLALQGAELVVVPTAWVLGFDARRWDAEGYCPQAHAAIQQANLDQVFIACASQVGTRDGIQFLGSSLVVDPFGTVVLGPMSGTEQVVGTVTVDLEDVGRAHQRSSLITPQADRRTDVYGIDLGGRRL